MTELEYWRARDRAITRSLDDDPAVVVLGGYVSLPFGPDDHLAERYPDRVLWPPISEFATAGLAVGAAIAGMRPLVAVGTSSFAFYGWAPIVNEAPNVRYLSGGAVRAPAVFHLMAGSRGQGGAQHEHTPQAMLQNVPGLRIFAPATPADVDSAFATALTGEDPTIVIDHVHLSGIRGEVGEAPQPYDGPERIRDGADVLLVASSWMVHHALRAAETLAADGVEAAVLNLRVTAPAPVAELLEHAAGFDRLVFVEESRAAGSLGSLLMASVLERFPGRTARLLARAGAPSPFAQEMLDRVVPSADAVVAAARELLR